MRKVLLLFFNNPKAYYYPGEWIRGYCQIDADGAKFNKIHLELEGFSNVSWSTSKIVPNQRTEEENRCLYLEKTILVETSTIGNGLQCWPFHFRLPEDVPPSFEGVYGHIRYWIKAEVRNNNANIGKALSQVFLRSNVNLNGEPFAAPVGGHVQEDISRPVVSNGTVTVHVQTDRSSYCENDFIILNGVIENNSNHSVISRIYLLQEQIFRAGGIANVYHQLRQMTPVACAPVIQTPIPRRQSRQWQGICILLVAASPSFRSPLIDVNYSIEIEVKGNFMKPAVLRLPILISTVPITNRGDRVLENIFPSILLGDESESDDDEAPPPPTSTKGHTSTSVIAVAIAAETVTAHDDGSNSFPSPPPPLEQVSEEEEPKHNHHSHEPTGEAGEGAGTDADAPAAASQET